MHELSICNALIEQVKNIASEHNAVRVNKIVLRIGPLSGIEAPLLQQAYPFAAAGTIAEHAVLVTESIPVRIQCTQCGAETEVDLNRLYCGTCGDFRTHLLSGDEMLLASLELTEAS
jgi:hydrogenase nickel incorporation protein HypA/HybF